MSNAEIAAASQAADDKQSMKHDYLAVFLIIIGLGSIGLGCHFHFVELTTSAAGVVGAGTGLIMGKRADNKSVNAGGNLAVTTEPGVTQ
jgi:hypothetical protein